MQARMVFRSRLISAGILASSLLSPPARGDDPSPALSEETMAVVKVDLARLDVAGLAKRWFGSAADAPEVAEFTRVTNDRVASLKQAGATELFLVFEFADFPGPPLIEVAAGPKVATDAVIKTLTQGLSGFSIPGGSGSLVGGRVLVGRPDALARARDRRRSARPDLTAALAVGAADAPIRAAISPGITLRRAVEESLPTLPAEFGGGSIAVLTQGMSWLSIVSPTDSTSKLQVTVQSTGGVSAQKLSQVFERGTQWASRNLTASPETSELAAVIGQLKPEVKGDQIQAELDLAKTVALIAIPVRLALESAQRARSINNLKHIGLAMNNYLSTHETFPPAFRADKNQKALLSWRVLILPFIEEQSLYNEFHLDEAWDSPHNKALIARMPKVYASPFASRSLVAEGKTVYLTPRGDQTMFPGATGIKIKEITDGTSNTIMTLEADDPNAVVWTRPDDWDVDARSVPAGKRLIVCFGDGSVRVLPKDLKLELLKKLLTRSGGEVIGFDE